MKLTSETHRMLNHRRYIRDMKNDGWEYVGENGGPLWELVRGDRWDHVITDVMISRCGKGLWVKAQPKSRHQDQPSQQD